MDINRKPTKLVSTNISLPVRKNQEPETVDGIEALLMEGLASGKPIEVTRAFWNKKRSTLTLRHKP